MLYNNPLSRVSLWKPLRNSKLACEMKWNLISKSSNSKGLMRLNVHRDGIKKKLNVYSNGLQWPPCGRG